MTAPTVVVVGGGPSGLAAAHRLRTGGAEVRVLEAADRLGGKMRTTERAGYLVDQGAFFVPTSHRRLLGLARELGMADEIVPGGFVLGVAGDGVIHTIDGDRPLRDLLRTRLWSPATKLALTRLLPEAVRARRASYDRLPECGRYDTGTLADSVRGRLRDEVADPVLRGIFATTARDAPRVDFLTIVNLLAGAKLVAFRGGMGGYAERISRDLKHELGARVETVAETAGGAVVTWRDAGGSAHREEVDGVVVALAAEDTRRVVSTLDPWRNRFLELVRNGRLFVLNVGLSAGPPGVDATYVLVPERAHPFLSGVMLDHHKAPGRVPPGRGLLSVAAIDSWCERHWADDDAAITAAMLDGVERLMPGTRALVEFTELHRWRQEYARVGYYRGLGRFRALCDADRRVHLAGALRSVSNLDTATRSGEDAARALLTALG